MSRWDGGRVSRRGGVFPVPWLTIVARDGCRLNSAAAVDAEDVPVGHHADESSSLRSARVS